MKGKLIGMQEISAYAKRTEATIMDWILKEGFPAEEEDGVWVSDTARVDSLYRAKAMEALG